MRKLAIILITMLTASVITISCALAQRQGFINVEGGDLAARLASARQRARPASTPARPHWVAYGFPVRRQVAVDVVIGGVQDAPTEFGVITGNVGQYETRNLGVFLLYADAGADAPARVEVYNLDRQRDFDGLPVYWLGRAEAAESLRLLRGFVGRASGHGLDENLTQAIALHDDPQAETMLEELARKSPSVGARTRAIFWLGRLGGHLPLLSELARAAGEPLPVRQEAVRAISKGSDANALSALRDLYASVNEQPLKEEIIDAAAKSRQPGAADFLTQIAQGDENSDLGRRARSRLDKATGEKQRQKGDIKVDKSMKGQKP
jgi:hypothetical protein